MLRELSIENLAIIEKASIAFGEHLNVFTGETGAGKSILIGGINAVLGGRVSKDIVRAGAGKAIVCALFDELPQRVKEILNENGYSDDDELILQREISADGKSTARINGRAATAAILKEVASELINIHGQHDNQLLMDKDKQREILDGYAGSETILQQYRLKFKEFSSISRKIKELSLQSKAKLERAELLRERLLEIDSLSFEKGEEDEINAKLTALRNAEYIQNNIYTALNAISGDEDPGAYSMLKTASDSISSLSEFLPKLEDSVKRIDNILIELDDIREDIALQMPDDGDDAASQLLYYEERLSNALKLRRKYGMELDEIIDVADKWRTELNEIENSDDIIDELSEKKREAAEQVKKLAAELTAKRKEGALLLAQKISEELTFLDMPDIRLVFEITQDKVTVNGMDCVEMLISVNKGEELKAMSRIASGGELSRIMLAVKNVLAQTDNVQTMIFDEVDTGISGRAAHKVGIKLNEAARSRQILCVTHLAQIAAMADTHLLIKKHSDDERTYTGITELDYDGRKRELARIISGNEDSSISLENAEELLKQRGFFNE